MALLATTISGNFSTYVYNIIDTTSARLFNSRSSIPNYGGIGSDILTKYWVPTGTIATSSTFIIGTTTPITHMGIRVSRWLQAATVSMCLLDNNSNIVSGSNITYSTANSLILYPADTTNISYSNGYGWHVFKFDSPITLSITNSYSIRFSKTITGNLGYLCTNADFYTASVINSTLSDIQRFFITSATQTATSNDFIHIQGEYVNSINNGFTISMDSTSSTLYNGIELSNGGSLVFKTASNTDYYLKLKGDLVINSGGLVSIGSPSFSFATSSTATIEFSSLTYSGSGLILRGYGTMLTYGATFTTKALLNSTAATSSVQTNITTNWNVGDSLVFAPTGIISTEYENKTIKTISGNNIILTNNLTYTHSGISPYIGEIANLSRNIKILGSSTYSTYIELQGGICDFKYTEFKFIGSALVPNGYLSNVGTSSMGNFRIGFGISFGSDFSNLKGQYTLVSSPTASGFTGLVYPKNRIFDSCSFNNLYNFFNNQIIWSYFSGNAQGPFTGGHAQLSDIIIDNNTIYNVNGSNYICGLFYHINAGQGFGYYPNSYLLNSATISNNLFIGVKTNTDLFQSFNYADFAFINNTLTGFYNSSGYWLHNYTANYPQIGDVSGNLFHSNGNGITSNSWKNGATFRFRRMDNFGKKINNCIFWRNNVGLSISNTVDTTFENLYCYDNIINFAMNGSVVNTTIINSTFSGNSFSNYGLSIIPVSFIGSDSSTDYIGLSFENCYFNGHNNPDIYINPQSLKNLPVYISMNNTKLLSSPIIVTGSSNISLDSSIRFSNLNNGIFSTYYKYGKIEKDNVIFLSASASTRAIPNTSNFWTNSKLIISKKVVPIPAGKRVKISVYVRKSGSGIEEIYTGSEINMLVVFNSSLGLTNDTIIATSTTASNLGEWEKITGVTPVSSETSMFEINLNCSGKTGFVNIDNWDIQYFI